MENLINVLISSRAPADFGRFAADAFATALSNVRRRRRKAGDPRLNPSVGKINNAY
jgi:hypothetical protein